MKRITVISFSHLARDSRVNRQIRFLTSRYRVTACGLGDPEIPGVRFVSSRPAGRRTMGRSLISALQLLLGQFERYYRTYANVPPCLRALSDVPADLVIANDIEALPAALTAARGRPDLFDAHEYAPRQHESRLVWRIFFQRYKTYLCRAYIPRAARMITVCRGIADQYARDTGVQPTVLTNAPDYEDLSPVFRSGRETRIRLVHHGAATPARKIENMIDMMRCLDSRFELDLVLVPGPKRYLEALRRRSRGDPRIRFLPPVPMRTLAAFLNQYDIGVCLFEPTTFNLLHALPNKFFEFIQARLALAVGPSPEMAAIVREHDCGVVSRDFSPQLLGACLSRLDHTGINYYKRQSHAIAHDMSAGRNRQILLRMVEGMLA